MRTIVLVQSRIGSHRLPAKALQNVNGRPMLMHVIQRATKIPEATEVWLATSWSDRDDPLVAVACRCDVLAWRGSEWDVLGRMSDAAKHAKADLVVRLTGDCPLLDPAVASHVINAWHSTKPDYIWNDTSRSGYPDGLDVEVFTMEALRLAAGQATRREDREHVTPWMRRMLRCGVVLCPDGDHSARKLSVDTPDNLDYVRRVFAKLHPDDHSMAATIAACEAVDLERADASLR